MVDEAGQDPVEVEPAADVAGDAAQRLGAMQQVGDLLLAPTDADDRAERIGEDGRQVAVGRVETAAPGPATTSSTPHGPSRPGMATASSLNGRRAGPWWSPDRCGRRTTADAPGALVGPRPRARGREVERPAEDAEPARQVEQARRWSAELVRRRHRGTSRSPRSSQMATSAVDRRSRGSRPRRDRGRRQGRRAEGFGGRSGRAGRGRADAVASIGRPSRAGADRARGSWSPGHETTARRALTALPWRPSARRALRGRQEPLQVAEPVAPIAPRVDPVDSAADRRRSRRGPCSGGRQAAARLW